MVKITESALRNMISESVSKILKEYYNDSMEDDMFRRASDGTFPHWEEKRKARDEKKQDDVETPMNESLEYAGMSDDYKKGWWSAVNEISGFLNVEDIVDIFEQIGLTKEDIKEANDKGFIEYDVIRDAVNMYMASLGLQYYK